MDLVAALQIDIQRIELVGSEMHSENVTLKKAQKTLRPTIIHVNILPPSAADQRSGKVRASDFDPR